MFRDCPVGASRLAHVTRVSDEKIDRWIKYVQDNPNTVALMCIGHPWDDEIYAAELLSSYDADTFRMIILPSLLTRRGVDLDMHSNRILIQVKGKSEPIEESERFQSYVNRYVERYQWGDAIHPVIHRHRIFREDEVDAAYRMIMNDITELGCVSSAIEKKMSPDISDNRDGSKELPIRDNSQQDLQVSAPNPVPDHVQWSFADIRHVSRDRESETTRSVHVGGALVVPAEWGSSDIPIQWNADKPGDL